MKFQDKVPSELSSKILTIGPDYRRHKGGVAAVIRTLSQYFEDFNFISTYKEGSVFLKGFVFFKGLVKFFSILLFNRKIKIIHIHGASYGSFYRKWSVFCIGKLLFNKKIIYHVHGGGFQKFYENGNWVSKKMINYFLRKADIIVCISLSWKEYFQHNHKTRNLIFLPNVIEYPKKQNFKMKGEIITFLFLGLISEQKGIFDLLEVIAKNKGKYDNKLKLLIAGNGKSEKLLGLIDKYETGNIVEFLGWVSGDNKIAALNKADVYILPSYIEGSPISILEAMSYGMPIISTNVGGIPELVKNNENGLLIEQGNLDQIEMALDFFVMNPGIIGTYGAVSEHLVQKHLPDSVLKQLIGMYQFVLSPTTAN